MITETSQLITGFISTKSEIPSDYTRLLTASAVSAGGGRVFGDVAPSSVWASLVLLRGLERCGAWRLTSSGFHIGGRLKESP
jgi:hypothetical protein